MSKESMEALARLTGTEINVRDMVDEWLLLTYDLPHNEVGDKARRKFLLEAMAIGATRHTDSVYLMPWTPSAEALALQLSRVAGGNVIVWTSKPTDQVRAQEITKSYDASLQPILEEISERIDRIFEYENKRWFKRANKMIPKTEKMLAQMEQAILRRGSASLLIYLQVLQLRFAKL